MPSQLCEAQKRCSKISSPSLISCHITQPCIELGLRIPRSFLLASADGGGGRSEAAEPAEREWKKRLRVKRPESECDKHTDGHGRTDATTDRQSEAKGEKKVEDDKTKRGE